MQDWSDVLSTFPARIPKLTDALHAKQYNNAVTLATDMIVDLTRVVAWVVREAINKGRR